MNVHTITAEKEVVRLQAFPADCWACGADATGLNLGIPVYEDLILPNDYEGEFGGVPACRGCFDKQQEIVAPTELREFLKA